MNSHGHRLQSFLSRLIPILISSFIYKMMRDTEWPLVYNATDDL